MMSLQFAYWAPNVSGGLVVSQLPQKTGWSFEDNKRYAQTLKKLDLIMCYCKQGFLQAMVLKIN